MLSTQEPADGRAQLVDELELGRRRAAAHRVVADDTQPRRRLDELLHGKTGGRGLGLERRAVDAAVGVVEFVEAQGPPAVDQLVVLWGYRRGRALLDGLVTDTRFERVTFRTGI